MTVAKSLTAWRSAEDAYQSAKPHTPKRAALCAKANQALDELIQAVKAAGWTRDCGLGFIRWAEMHAAKTAEGETA